MKRTLLAHYDDDADFVNGDGEELLESKTLEKTSTVFTAEDEELKSWKTKRNWLLRKHPVGAQAVALLAQSMSTEQNLTSQDKQSSVTYSMSNKIVFTETEEFVTSLQVNEDEQSVSRSKDAVAFVDEEVAVEKQEDVVVDETIHQVPAGKGLYGVLKLLKEQGSLEETVDWGGRNTDKKKSKLHDTNEAAKEIRIDRFDEFGRRMTQKEQFRKLSHAFHGKEPGKKKKEKRIRQAQEELRMKKMKNSDTPSLSVERMRQAQARLQTPYLVLSGKFNPLSHMF